MQRVRQAVGAYTMVCIAGGIAEAYWGVPGEIEQQTLRYLDGQFRGVVGEFHRRFRMRDHKGTDQDDTIYEETGAIPRLHPSVP